MGSKIGAVIGGVAGAVAGSGWGSVAGAAAGASSGASVGNMIGEGISPSKQGSTSIERRLSAGTPAPLTGSEKLKQSIMALHQAPEDVRREYAAPLVSSYLDALTKERTGQV